MFDLFASSAWYDSPNPFVELYPGELSPANLVGADYESPFEAPVSPEAQLGHDLALPASILVGLFTRNPLGAMRRGTDVSTRVARLDVDAEAGFSHLDKIPASTWIRLDPAKVNAFKNMGSLEGKGVIQADMILKKNGFLPAEKFRTPGGYYKYHHESGAKVYLRPDGQVYRFSGKNQNTIRYNHQCVPTGEHGQEFLF
ncbi:hypothetical protein ACJJIX_20725 [Microbulbifer sp. VAAC004]|uniref:hypothetical protein n=1 Tax=unclassified Microbulbifer TaxID=2619833 RepID=UPI00403A023C